MQQTIGNLQINYEFTGEGETTLVLLHGWGGSIKSLYPIYSTLSEDLPSLILDLPGFGNSSAPSTAWDLDDYVKCLHDLFIELHIKKVILLGHSFGGALSLNFAIKYPEMVSRLVVCAPSYNRSGRQSIKVNISNQFSFYSKIKPYLKLPRKLLYKVFVPDSDLFKAQHLEPTFLKVTRHDLTPYVSSIKAPTLIMWGTKDKDVPVQHAYMLDELLPTSKLIIFENQTHGFPLFNPDEVSIQVQSFLSDLK